MRIANKITYYKKSGRKHIFATRYEVMIKKYKRGNNEKMTLIEKVESIAKKTITISFYMREGQEPTGLGGGLDEMGATAPANSFGIDVTPVESVAMPRPPLCGIPRCLGSTQISPAVGPSPPLSSLLRFFAGVQSYVPKL